MRAEIALPDGTHATLSQDGRWRAETAMWQSYLDTIARDYPGRFYLPDPFAERLRGTLAEIEGAELVREELPPEDPRDGLDEQGRLLIH
jgi:hypothetical protein